jgi:hypothetical protein
VKPAEIQQKASKDQRGWERFAKERVAERQFAKVGSNGNRGKLGHLFRRKEGAMMIMNISRDPKSLRPAPVFVEFLF